MKRVNRVALVSTPYLAVPPRDYGGIERIVDYLSQDLRRNHGCSVDLFAPRNSTADVDQLYSMIECGILENGTVSEDDKRRLMKEFSKKTADVLTSGDHDIIHIHYSDSDTLIKRLIDAGKKGIVFSTHNMPSEELLGMMQRFSPYITHVALSRAHRNQYADLKDMNIVVNGIDISGYSYSDRSLKTSEEEPAIPLLRNLKNREEDYALIVSCISSRKGQATAIDVAKRTKTNLIVVGRPNSFDTEGLIYFERYVQPCIDGRNIFYLEGACEAEKRELMKFARCFVFPTGMEDTSWNDPCPTVVLEAFAGGTPVIATNKGTQRETIVDGVGFLADDAKEMASYLDAVMSMDNEEYKAMRRMCRRRAEDVFTVERMTNDYYTLYQRVLNENK